MDDFAADVVTPIDTTVNRDRKKFKPWHKPRKQWCRNHQWLLGFNWVIDTHNSQANRPAINTFNYLGLPGDDLLDLRIFAHGCGKKGVLLKYLGFMTGRSDQLQLSESELHKTGNIASGSAVINEPLESLAKKTSSAYAETKSYNGFHLINFDLCNSIAGNQNSEENYIDALKNILELQMNFMREPWTLFITTYACKESISAEVMTKLLEIISSNNKNQTFSSRFEEELLIEPSKITYAIDDITLLDDQEYFDLFALGFSKWILQICQSVSNNWKISMTPSCKYTTGNPSFQKEPNMASFAFKFEHIFQHADDPLAPARPMNEETDNSETSLALKMITGVTDIFNLDLKIENDLTLKNSLFTHSKNLLVAANYQEEEYQKWVDDGCLSD